MYVCIYVCICIYIYVCMYVCIYIHAWTIHISFLTTWVVKQSQSLFDIWAIFFKMDNMRTGPGYCKQCMEKIDPSFASQERISS